MCILSNIKQEAQFTQKSIKSTYFNYFIEMLKFASSTIVVLKLKGTSRTRDFCLSGRGLPTSDLTFAIAFTTT